mmetsp:Transcript_113951/g.302825  ORF Transcript_113951/g.302825 Transcript_113951/m.302825 type:complete len:370 (+) Transcript_113951:714-1823(+)
MEKGVAHSEPHAVVHWRNCQPAWRAGRTGERRCGVGGRRWLLQGLEAHERTLQCRWWLRGRRHGLNAGCRRVSNLSQRALPGSRRGVPRGGVRTAPREERRGRQRLGVDERVLHEAAGAGQGGERRREVWQAAAPRAGVRGGEHLVKRCAAAARAPGCAFGGDILRRQQQLVEKLQAVRLAGPTADGSAAGDARGGKRRRGVEDARLHLLQAEGLVVAEAHPPRGVRPLARRGAQRHARRRQRRGERQRRWRLGPGRSRGPAALGGGGKPGREEVRETRPPAHGGARRHARGGQRRPHRQRRQRHRDVEAGRGIFEAERLVGAECHAAGLICRLLIRGERLRFVRQEGQAVGLAQPVLHGRAGRHARGR